MSSVDDSSTYIQLPPCTQTKGDQPFYQSTVQESLSALPNIGESVQNVLTATSEQMYRRYLNNLLTDSEISSITMAFSDVLQVVCQKIASGDQAPVSDITVNDATELLKEDDVIIDAAPRGSIIGYLTYPHYSEIGTLLQSWMETNKCPVDELLSYDLLDEKKYAQEREEASKQVSLKLQSMQGKWDSQDVKERIVEVVEILQLLGKRGLLDLLGIRRTVGSVEMWPPPRAVLENTFNMLQKPDTASTLTVGARALTKHCHRDMTNSWWGKVTRSESAKNEHAKYILKKILDSAMWINIYILPHDVHVIEVRAPEDYGMRWSADGFLEAQMADGHAVGWRH